MAGKAVCDGMGHLGRAHGLTTDNLLSAEVVLSDGGVLVAGESELPELFWALRGAAATSAP